MIGGGEDGFDLGDGFGVRAEGRVRETDERAGAFDAEPGGGQLLRDGGGGIDLELDAAEAIGEGGHLFGEDEAALLEVADVAGEALDFGEIVRREKDGGLADAVDQALNQFVTDERVEAGEGLV